MLQYKCEFAGVWFEQVNEANSTQTCSCCGKRTVPKGGSGLGIREWRCPDGAMVHDRDLNAARNMRGHRGRSSRVTDKGPNEKEN